MAKRMDADILLILRAHFGVFSQKINFIIKSSCETSTNLMEIRFLKFIFLQFYPKIQLLGWNTMKADSIYWLVGDRLVMLDCYDK